VHRLDFFAVGGADWHRAALHHLDGLVLAEAPGRNRNAAVADPPPHAADAGRSTGTGGIVSSPFTAITTPRFRRRAAVLDVSGLAPGAFGHRSLIWWGTLGLFVIEGTMFAIAIAAYFYLRMRNTTWPPNVPPPDLRWGTVNTLILLASA